MWDGAFNVGDPTLFLVRTGLNGRTPSCCQRIVWWCRGKNAHIVPGLPRKKLNSESLDQANPQRWKIVKWVPEAGGKGEWGVNVN